MPKDKKKGKQHRVGPGTVQTEDGFDDMLAEFHAADLAAPTDTTSTATTTTSATSSNSASFSNSSGTTSSNNTKPMERLTTSIEEASIVRSCVAGDMIMLRR
jgi:hypothetical protein